MTQAGLQFRGGELKALRPHQQVALQALRRSLAEGHQAPLVQAPTGYGKTVLAAHIVAGALQRRKRVAFCVPSISLIDQSFERFIENGISPEDMGVMQGAHPWRRPQAPVQICSAQTLARRSLPEVDVAIIDEAHLRFRVYDRWMHDTPRPIFIGLSATPWSKGLGRNFDDLIKPISMIDLIDQGYLSNFVVFAPSSPDLEAVRTRAGDYVEGDLEKVMNTDGLVGDVVQNWLARAKGLPTLCFCVNRRHARAIHAAFREAGIAAAYVDANTPREEREELGRQLKSGEVQVVCNIGTLTTGVDWDVRCIILARPTKSPSLYVQIIGRGLRTAPGKEHCIILDHSDTTMRLGLVTDIDFDLDDGKRTQGAPRAVPSGGKKPRRCKSCAAVVPHGDAHCQVCGEEMPKPAPVEHHEGDLVQIGGPKARTRQPSLTDILRARGAQRIYSELLGIAAEKGRKEGWAAHTFKVLFGGWPRGLMKAAIQPSQEIRAYIRYRDIAYFKARQPRGRVAA